MEPEISRESWSICIEPNEATDPSFRSLKVLFTLQEILLCAEKQNISGEIQRKKRSTSMNWEISSVPISTLTEDRKKTTEKWSMTAKFNKKDYISIFFTDEAQKNCENQK